MYFLILRQNWDKHIDELTIRQGKTFPNILSEKH